MPKIGNNEGKFCENNNFLKETIQKQYPKPKNFQEQPQTREILLEIKKMKLQSATQ